MPHLGCTQRPRCIKIAVPLVLASVLVLSALPASIAAAAGHHEITVIPVGPARITSGIQDVSYRLPMGPRGALPQPVVLLARQPWTTDVPAPLRPDIDEDSGTESKQQVPAVIKFTVAGRELPAWTLQPHGTAYVINLDTLETNPEWSKNRLAMKVEVSTSAEDVAITLLGMPDPLLLDSQTNGALGDLAGAATDPDVRAYFHALATEIADNKEAAREQYTRLRSAKNDRVARFARRGLRMLSYELRKRKLSGNIMEHYRWGLYLQQCGLYSPAHAEFEECRIIAPQHGDSQFRAGECMDRIGGPLNRILDYMDRTIEAASPFSHIDWHALVVILKSRGERTLSADEVRQIKDSWLAVERIIGAATNGKVRLITAFFDVSDEQAYGYAMRNGCYAPGRDIVEVRGWFDGVFSIVPRDASESDKDRKTFMDDAGCNGAALSCLFHDTEWPEYLAAWYDQVTLSAEVAELPGGYPVAAQAVGCGHRPARHEGYAYRAALRYFFTPAMCRRLKTTDLPVPGSAVQLWKIEGPYPVEGAPAEPDAHHVLDPIPSSPASKSVRYVADHDFVDLAEVFPDSGHARAKATSWVYSPEDQEVRMWLGRNDGMALWLNGRLVRAGRHYATGDFEDRNLVDTVASCAFLRRGWNEIQAVVESLPAPRNKGWGFSVRFCTWDNRPIVGLACVNRLPEEDVAPRFAPPGTGAYYAWPGVQYDYHHELPALDTAALEGVTGVKGLTVTGAIDTFDGYVAFIDPGMQASSATYRPLTEPWQIGTDRDVVLNNVLDWAREACAAYRYRKDGKTRDLLLIKPEAVQAYLALLREPAAAAELFGQRPVDERLLGYVVVPAGRSVRTLIVVDTLLGESNAGGDPTWPVDEEDLLTPFGPQVWNTDLQPVGPAAPPAVRSN